MWKKMRGKLGYFHPLLGTWHAQADSPTGPVHCTRTYRRVLNGKFVQLSAHWETSRAVYEELAYFGERAEGTIGFWSFTSDGKHSEGIAADATDIHPQAIGFEAPMPAGLARTAYWPDDEDGFFWVVEAKTKTGWRRFLHHHYRPQ